MSITFQDWHNWTNDEGIPTYTLDWSSPEAMKHYPPRVIVEALRQAVLERNRLIGLTLSDNLNTEIQQNRPVHERNPISLCTDIHNAVSALIPHFINLTDSGGNWHGKPNTYDIPNWTENSILGNNDRILVAQNFPLWAAWAFQTQKIIDNLRWISETPYYCTEKGLNSVTLFPAEEYMERYTVAPDTRNVDRDNGEHYIEPANFLWSRAVNVFSNQTIINNNVVEWSTATHAFYVNFNTTLAACFRKFQSLYPNQRGSVIIYRKKNVFLGPLCFNSQTDLYEGYNGLINDPYLWTEDNKVAHWNIQERNPQLAFPYASFYTIGVLTLSGTKFLSANTSLDSTWLDEGPHVTPITEPDSFAKDSDNNHTATNTGYATSWKGDTAIRKFDVPGGFTFI